MAPAARVLPQNCINAVPDIYPSPPQATYYAGSLSLSIPRGTSLFLLHVFLTNQLITTMHPLLLSLSL